MQSEPTHEQPRDWDVMEREAVYLMTDPEHHPPIWSVADLGREMETRDPMAVVRPLRDAGLVNLTSENYVFATPAAYKMVGLVGQVV
jgi:hypothetical protein